MSRKLNMPKYAFSSDYPFFYLPDLLNFHGVTLEDFRAARFTTKPGLLWLTAVECRRQKKYRQAPYSTEATLAKDIAEARHYWKSAIRQGQVKEGERIPPRNIDGLLGRLRVTAGDLRDFLCKTDVDDYYTENGQAKAVIAGTFSSPNSCDMAELAAEGYVKVECPDCTHDELVEAHENPLDSVGEFEHLTGPYCRCSNCESVVRPIITWDQEEVPDDWTPDCGGTEWEEWEDYKDHLSYLVGLLKAHLASHGFPEPNQLRIEIARANWRGSAAYALCEVSGTDIADNLRVNGEYLVSDGELRLYQGGKAEMTCRFSHHDVPTGSGVTIFPIWENDIEDGEPLGFDEMVESQAWVAETASILLNAPVERTDAVTLSNAVGELIDDELPNERELTEEGQEFGLAVWMLFDRVAAQIKSAKADGHVIAGNTRPVLPAEAKLLRQIFDAYQKA